MCARLLKLVYGADKLMPAGRSAYAIIIYCTMLFRSNFADLLEPARRNGAGLSSGSGSEK